MFTILALLFFLMFAIWLYLLVKMAISYFKAVIYSLRLFMYRACFRR